LVSPIEVVRLGDYSYWAVITPSIAEKRAAAAFGDWLFELGQIALGEWWAPQ